MTDDVEDTLASLEQRLRALQSELDTDGEPAPPDLRRFEPPPAPSPLDPRDALDRFGAELRRLVDAWERTAAELRGGAADATVFRGGVALEARGELRQLCALERALTAVPGVTSVRLRAYAGGAAALEVALDRDVALVAELRRAVAFDLVHVGGGRLSIALS
ncbi:MAG TPA: hypothetical protein VGW75_16190 [Solirubrobacteraceae bacterium]|jgi:hypothetical protein|nr:hypothetical protein [Solirubrobacteraceae bacterium]